MHPPIKKNCLLSQRAEAEARKVRTETSCIPMLHDPVLGFSVFPRGCGTQGSMGALGAQPALPCLRAPLPLVLLAAAVIALFGVDHEHLFRWLEPEAHGTHMFEEFKDNAACSPAQLGHVGSPKQTICRGI